MVLEVTDGSFEDDVLNSKEPVLVDFWAEWCGPCRQLTPVIESIAADMHGKLKVVKVNIDENPDTPTKFGVRGIPTLMVFKEGKLHDTKVGALPKSLLVDWINSKL
ncbi:MAG: thioredoxin [Alphaproteobacteria bacterium]|nr:thioredoxin [Alphaproteobacteria bacterium]OJV14069.1 MAG: thioredoxin [Alphaproteobacteria bacterium 33-17]